MSKSTVFTIFARILLIKPADVFSAVRLREYKKDLYRFSGIPGSIQTRNNIIIPHFWAVCKVK